MDDRELAKELGRRFIQRRDAKAVQVEDGGYRRLKQAFTLDDLLRHLRGEVTYGHYLVDHDGLCRVFAFDIDLTQKGQWREDVDSPWQDCEPRAEWLSSAGSKVDLILQLRCLAEALALRTARLFGTQVAVAYSGAKGLHVYAWLEEPRSAAVARQMAVTVLDDFDCFEASRGENFFRHRDAFRCCEIEVYPKQDAIHDDGYGNLLRLPLGVNRKTGQAGFFLDLRQGLGMPFAADAPARVFANGSVQ